MTTAAVLDDEVLADDILVAACLGADNTPPQYAHWVAGIVLLADFLLRSDHFTRERLLRGLNRELRDALVGIPAIMQRGRAQ